MRSPAVVHRRAEYLAAGIVASAQIRLEDEIVRFDIDQDADGCETAR
jgi:hypothetical protein